MAGADDFDLLPYGKIQVPKNEDLIAEFARTSDHPTVVSAREQLCVVVLLAHGEEIADRIRAGELRAEQDREALAWLRDSRVRNTGFVPASAQSKHKSSFVKWLLGKT